MLPQATTTCPSPTPIRHDRTPIHTIRRWPADVTLAAILAGDPAGRTRWSLLANPTAIERHPTLDAALARITEAQTRPGTDEPSGFGPGWIVSIPYAVGHAIEPSASVNARRGSCIQPEPIRLARVERGYIHDNRHTNGDNTRAGSWTAFGEPGPMPQAESDARCSLGACQGLDRRAAYEAGVERCVGLIRAGDAFQISLAHRLSAALNGSPRALFADLAERLRPWHGCYLEDGRWAMASASPELFLEADARGRVVTRPMKGTRSGDDPTLGLSPKDAAELAMIVDLMRNDLGRVCAFGSVRVRDARSIEPHGGEGPSTPSVWQGVATVDGRLREGVGLGELFAAAFPPGSVTGAPKIRAMQIIDELEPALGFEGPMRRRGAYCGCAGFVGDDGAVVLNVAIRSAIIEDGLCHYPVGAGIVADSNPAAEWHETLVKASAFLGLCRGEGACP